MKINVQKQTIESILINLQPFLEKKDATQITSHVLFIVKENYCTIKATDMEIGLQIVTDTISVLEEGAFTAHGKKLLDIIRILKDEEIVLENSNDTLHIQQKHSKFKLPTFNSDTFPEFPTYENKSKITIDSLSLIKNIKKISSSIDTNNPKFELNGALINIKKENTDFVGTDTRRLAIVSMPNSSEEELSVIIPKKAILEIQKLFLDTIDIFFDQANFIIKNQNYYFFTKLINGKFPDYQRIIPSNIKHTLILPKKEMIDAIKMIIAISQDIKLTITSDKILFNSLSKDNIEAKTEIEIDTQLTESFELAINSRYLLDFISQIDGSQFEIGFNEPNLPFIVKEGNFMTIIMPIVI